MINGNALPPVRVGNKRMIKNTCLFDATIQCIIGGYSEWSEYNKYVEQLCNSIFTLIRSISMAGITQKVYCERAAIMNRIVSSKNNVIDCEMNVSSLISKLMYDVPSLEYTYICDECGFQRKTINPVLNVNTIPLYKQGMKGLQEAVQCYQIQNPICNRCKGSKVNSNYIGGEHIFIDIECLDNELLASRLGYPDSSKQFTLAELSTELYFCEIQYKLVAAIIYIPGENIGHYLTYVRKITDRWQKYDSLSADKRPRLITNRELLQKKRIHILYYVKSQNQTQD